MGENASSPVNSTYPFFFAGWFQDFAFCVLPDCP
jgi:hypothetical protein